MKKLFLPAIVILLFLIFSGIFTLSAQQLSQSAAQQPGQSAAQKSEELAEQGLLFTLATELPYRAGTYRKKSKHEALHQMPPYLFSMSNLILAS